MTFQGDALEESLRRELASFSRRVARLGFAPGTSGNLSVRLDEDRLLLTPTGVSKAMVRASDMVIADMNGRLLAGTRRVTSEIGMHLAIYARRQDVRAVLHAHPPIATAFACCGRGLDEALCQEAVMTIGTVPLARYATTGTDEVASSLLPYVDRHDAILLENHGAVTSGGSLLNAFQKMETLEHVAQVVLIAHQLGTPHLLRTEQVQQLHQARTRYLQNADGPDPAFAPQNASKVATPREDRPFPAHAPAYGMTGYRPKTELEIPSAS